MQFSKRTTELIEKFAEWVNSHQRYKVTLERTDDVGGYSSPEAAILNYATLHIEHESASDWSDIDISVSCGLLGRDILSHSLVGFETKRWVIRDGETFNIIALWDREDSYFLFNPPVDAIKIDLVGRHVKVGDWREAQPVSHYAGTDGVDVIAFIEQQWGAEAVRGFMAGNIIKYATRLGRKDDEDKELAKIIDYAERYRKYIDKGDN